MAPMIYTKSICSRERIEISHKGNMMRDFTYIYDTLNATKKLIEKQFNYYKIINKEYSYPCSTSSAPDKILNTSNQESIAIMNSTELLDIEIGFKVIKTFNEFQLYDIQSTSPSNKLLHNWTGLKPYKSIIKRIRYFIEFYQSYYPLN
tara:strand:+ start:140 stop:583 length:444 start_codon:yes stop_codon:yes gene_type:complete